MADTKKLQTGDEIALAALSQRSEEALSEDELTSEDEVEKSNRLAETLTSLQNLIERNADLLGKVQNDLREKRESLRSVFENDSELSMAEDEVAQLSGKVKERKAKVQSTPEVVTFRNQIGELNEQKKDLEMALSDHLVNYYQLTNSKSFDTSDGDQWEFQVSAKVKPKRKK